MCGDLGYELFNSYRDEEHDRGKRKKVSDIKKWSVPKWVSKLDLLPCCYTSCLRTFSWKSYFVVKEVCQSQLLWNVISLPNAPLLVGLKVIILYCKCNDNNKIEIVRWLSHMESWSHSSSLLFMIVTFSFYDGFQWWAVPLFPFSVFFFSLFHHFFFFLIIKCDSLFP